MTAARARGTEQQSRQRIGDRRACGRRLGANAAARRRPHQPRPLTAPAPHPAGRTGAARGTIQFRRRPRLQFLVSGFAIDGLQVMPVKHRVLILNRLALGIGDRSDA